MDGLENLSAMEIDPTGSIQELIESCKSYSLLTPFAHRVRCT